MMIALAVCAGCPGPEAIGELAQHLNHHQRRRMRCRPRPGKRREYDVPSVDTFRRTLKEVDSAQLANSLIGWMKAQDPHPAEWVHFDGKVLQGAEPAPAADPKTIQAHVPTEMDPQPQKPKANKALTLVNFMTDDQKLIQQLAVPSNTNEEAATTDSGLTKRSATRPLANSTTHQNPTEQSPHRGVGNRARIGHDVQPSGRPSEGLSSGWTPMNRERLICLDAESGNNKSQVPAGLEELT